MPVPQRLAAASADWVLPKCPSRRGSAFTLVECLLSMAVLAIAVSSVLVPLLAGQKETAYALYVQQALTLTEEMMDRVVTCPYNQMLATWNGQTEAPGNVRDVSGALYPKEYQVFQRTVGVLNSSQNVAGLGGAIPGLTVSVTIQDAGAGVWVITRFVPQPS